MLVEETQHRVGAASPVPLLSASPPPWQLPPAKSPLAYESGTQQPWPCRTQTTRRLLYSSRGPSSSAATTSLPQGSWAKLVM